MKFLTTIGILLFVLLLSSCGVADSPTLPEPAAAQTSQSTSAEPAAFIADSAAVGAAIQKSEKAAACSPQSRLPFVKSKFPTMNVWAYYQYIVIDGAAKPPHSSPYFPKGTPGWEPFYKLTPNSFQNPNTINPYKWVRFVMPACPAWQATPSPTGNSAIGISSAGVPFYNQYAGGGAALDWRELLTFDRWNGHPDEVGTYHYHKEPYFLTYPGGVEKKHLLIGYLIDGYPVYGPREENGVWVNNSMLDSAHGHWHKTSEFPDGTYHYHVTDEAPYINGGGYRGTPGWFQQ